MFPEGWSGLRDETVGLRSVWCTFEHALRFAIKTALDRIVFFENGDQRRHRRVRVR